MLNEMESDSPDQFRMSYRKELELNFRDFDSFHHVNNGIYFLWFENARANLTKEVMQVTNILDIPITMAST
ncbi:MAG: hypothetical protein ACREBU_10675, partial [Nitrososphaera sp.]